MRVTLIQLSLLSIITITLIGCNDIPTNESVVIKIHAPSQVHSKVEVVTINMLNYEEILLKSTTLDSIGNSSIEISITKPILGKIKIGELSYKIYLEPNFELQVSLISNLETNSIKYSGKGSQPNNYLIGSSSVLTSFHSENPNWWGKDFDQFSNIIDSLQSNLKDFHLGYLDTTLLSVDIQKMFDARNDLSLINLKQQYKLINNEAYKIENTPNSARNISDNIPLESEYLDLSMAEYAMALDLVLRIEIQEPMYKGILPEQLDSLNEYFPIISHKLIKQTKFPSGIKEFLIAKNITHWLASEGLSSGLDSIYSEFKKDFKNSIYSNQLESKYQEWISISAGHQAPEITGLTIEKDTISLSELKGKIVYIDVWATWCAPCRAEFPFYKNLQKEFEGNSNIEFFFVSIDKDAEKWSKFLIQETMPRGIQVNEIESKHPSVQVAYKIWGVPRYILIDREGKIVNPKAPKPSSGKVAGLIKDLII